MRVTVVGAGISGLTCALRLREDGHDVEVLAAEPPERTTSSVAAALWYPYRALPQHAVTRWSAATYAALVGLADRKGRLAVGYDADIVVWDDTAEHIVQAAELRHRHKISPYVGRKLRGRVEQTWVGGKLAFDHRHGLSSRPVGSFVAVHR